MVREDRRLTVRLISDELALNRNSIRRIITEDLEMRKVCAKMVPHLESSSTSSLPSMNLLCRIKTVEQDKVLSL